MVNWNGNYKFIPSLNQFPYRYTVVMMRFSLQMSITDRCFADDNICISFLSCKFWISNFPVAKLIVVVEGKWVTRQWNGGKRTKKKKKKSNHKWCHEKRKWWFENNFALAPKKHKKHLFYDTSHIIKTLCFELMVATWCYKTDCQMRTKYKKSLVIEAMYRIHLSLLPLERDKNQNAKKKKDKNG